jgi:hypothetical protein
MDSNIICDFIKTEIHYLLMAQYGWANTSFQLIWNSDTKILQIVDFKHRIPGGIFDKIGMRNQKQVLCNRITFLLILRKLIFGSFIIGLRFSVSTFLNLNTITEWGQIERIERDLESTRNKKWNFIVKMEMNIVPTEIIELRLKKEMLKIQLKNLEKQVRINDFALKRKEVQAISSFFPVMHEDIELIEYVNDNNSDSEWSSSSSD